MLSKRGIATGAAWLASCITLALSVGCGSVAELGDLTSTSSVEDVQAVPTAIRIQSIGVNGTDVAPMGLQVDGTVEVPPLNRIQQLGYYCPEGPPACGAPAPGEIGPAVLLAHINGHGKPGLFADLSKVKKGDLVEVDRSDGMTATFEVTEVQIVDKDRFPTGRVYGDLDHPGLRLVTCGPFDLDRKNHRYRDQTVVYADLVSLRPSAA